MGNFRRSTSKASWSASPLVMCARPSRSSSSATERTPTSRTTASSRCSTALQSIARCRPCFSRSKVLLFRLCCPHIYHNFDFCLPSSRFACLECFKTSGRTGRFYEETKASKNYTSLANISCVSGFCKVQW